MNPYEYDIDFYSNDHQMDVFVTAEMVEHGKFTKGKDYFDVHEDPDFKIISVVEPDENKPVELSKEELRRVTEILCNIYWNSIQY